MRRSRASRLIHLKRPLYKRCARGFLRSGSLYVARADKRGDVMQGTELLYPTVYRFKRDMNYNVKIILEIAYTAKIWYYIYRGKDLIYKVGGLHAEEFMKNATEIYRKYVEELNETGSEMQIEIIETSASSNNFALLKDMRAGEGYHLAMINYYGDIQLIRFYNKSEKVDAYRAFNALKFKSSEMLRP